MRITGKFKELKQKGQKALITYLTAGDPDLEMTADLVLAAEENGADIIELGIPFSDPLADGPVIQKASLRALNSGTTVSGILGCIKNIRTKTQIPIAVMTYYNPIHRYGLKEFAVHAKEAGVDGLIVPDLPYEEGEELYALAKDEGLETILFVAPTSTTERIKKTAELSTGFIYCVSLTGVTGPRDDLQTGVRELISRIKDCTDKPVALGFGISHPEQARRAAEMADGVIVGSAIVKMIGEKRGEELLKDVGSFVRELKKACC
jgi:tryptophan synthase alpha chain